MNILIPGILLAGCIVLLILEMRGVRTTLTLEFKGDLKRESRWLAQYGQAVSVLVASLLVWELDSTPRYRTITAAIVISAILSGVLGMLLKRLTSRVRPNREHEGKFLGPTWRHANWRESFPSSHTAGAFAMSVVLSGAYPHAAPTFYGLAVVCGVLRYLLSAHFPSDVLAGAAMGYAIGILTLQGLNLI